MNDDRLREVLPLLRPRSAEPTLFSQTVFYLLWAGLALLVALYVLRWYRIRRRRRLEFVEAATEAGLTDRQTAFLLDVVRRQRLKRPLSLLTSAHAFDRHLGRHAAALARRDLDHPQLATIARLRTKLDFDELPTEQALSSTRQIERGVTVMVWEEDDLGAEQYRPWLVLERDEGALTLAPLLREPDGSGSGLQQGDEITVRFWREGDTEYRFESHVIGAATAPAVLVEHADVERMQLRDFYRIDVDLPIEMRWLPPSADEDDERQVAQDAAISLLDRGPDARAGADASPGTDPGTGAAEGAGARDEGQREPGVEGLRDEGLRDDGLRDLGPDPARRHQGPRAAGDGDGVRVESTTAAPGGATRPQGPPETPGDGLEAAARLRGRVRNLSAGGLALLVESPLPEGAEQGRWIVDPAYDGGFPLAGLECRAVGTEDTSVGLLVKLNFLQLPVSVEKEIVRGVYEHQLLGAGGRAAPEADAGRAPDGDAADADGGASSG